MEPSHDFASRQIIGARDYQEDRSFITPYPDSGAGAGLLAVVADGMGGHVAGDLAAELAIEAFVGSLDLTSATIADGFVNALSAANHAIARKVLKHPEKDGMGCTFVGVDCGDTSLRWVSVGDSILYLYSQGSLTRLNADHSLAPQLDAAASRGEMTWEEAQNSSSRHVLRSALTGGSISLVDFPRSAQKISQKDWVIVATDGLDTLQKIEIETIIARLNNGSAQNLCDAMISAIEGKKQSYQDNTAIIVISVSPLPNYTSDVTPTRPISAR